MSDFPLKTLAENLKLCIASEAVHKLRALQKLLLSKFGSSLSFRLKVNQYAQNQTVLLKTRCLRAQHAYVPCRSTAHH